MPRLAEVDSVAARTGFAGVVRVDRGGETIFAQAYGLACRAHEIENRIDTRFAIASGAKGLTALAVVSLIEDGALRLDTTARSVLGGDLPLIGGDVTVEHLLAHRSGIGDYLDEEAVAAHVGRLRLPFHELVRQRVPVPAGMPDTEFLRSDELPSRTATGYLPIEGVSRTNVFHLPVRGSGDGGLYSTAADFSAFWPSLFAGRIVSAGWAAEMTRPRSDVPEESMRYGLGFWLHPSASAVILIGYDAGVSFRSVHDPATGTTHTVISNSSGGAWPVTALLDELMDF